MSVWLGRSSRPPLTPSTTPSTTPSATPSTPTQAPSTMTTTTTTTQAPSTTTTTQAPSTTTTLTAFAGDAPLRAPTASGARGAGLSVQANAMRRTPEMAASEKLNAKVVKKYPKLAAICGDPAGLMRDFEARFAAQKARTPHDPYLFDVADVFLPIVGDMKDALAAEVQQLTARRADLVARRDRGPALLRPMRDTEIAKIDLGLTYLQRLTSDTANLHDSGKLTYRELQVMGFFTARALGIFDMHKIGLRDRSLLQVDRYLQGHNAVDLVDEIARYDRRDFAVFDRNSPVGGFARAHDVYANAFFDPDRLRMISIPFADSLGAEPFMRLVPYNIFLAGMTRDPAAADGFVRPGEDFWIHDIRHSSAIFEKRERYEADHHVSPENADALRGKIDRWKTELDEERARIPDKELRYAIGFFMFNFHHDRGYPMVPSSYDAPEALNFVPKFLYGMLKVSGQPTGFSDMNRTLDNAFAWLQRFWSQRADEERALWGTPATRADAR